MQDTTYDDWESRIAQEEINNWENRDQYGIEW